MKLTLDTATVPMRDTFVAGHGSVAERQLLVVTLESQDGVVGYGEAAPLPSYDGTSIAEVSAALEQCRSVLAAGDRAQRADLLARCAEAVVLPQALAAIDLALWDLEGKRTGVPVWRLLGAGASDTGGRLLGAGAPDTVGRQLGTGTPQPEPVNWTIAAADRAGAAREAATARAGGYGTVKAKVAIGDDAGRLAAIRAVAGADMRIRIDANGAWTPAEAQAALRVLAPVGIELCEEPVAGIEAIRRLAATTDIPLALDESTAAPGALDRRACALACLKVSGSGGLTGLLDAATRARAAGYEVYLASTLDGPLGIAAALHAAAVLSPMRACGLATLGLFSGRPDLLRAHAGAIPVPAGPGLGQGLRDWYDRG